MNLNYTVSNVFPITIHQISDSNFDQIKPELIEYAYNLKEIESITNGGSNVKGFQSKPFKINNNDDILHNFINKSTANMSSIGSSVEMNIWAWINVNPPSAYHIKHMHPQSNLSGVLWIKTPKNCGKVVFENPLSFQASKEIFAYTELYRKNTNTHLYYEYEPYEGGMLIFPSYLEHLVEPNESEEDRISVAFNIQLENKATTNSLIKDT